MDTEYRRALRRHEQHMAVGPYDHLVGEWVFGMGARKNWRGRLLRVVPGYEGSQTVFHLHPFYEVCSSDAASVAAEEKQDTTEDMPVVVLEGGLIEMRPQPKAWPTE